MFRGYIDPEHRRNLAWKVGGDLTFLFLPCPLSRLPLVLHPYFTHSLPCCSFLIPLNLARRSGKHCKLPTVPSEKRQQVAKVGGDQIHLDR